MCNQHKSYVALIPGVEMGVSSELSFLLYNHIMGWDALYPVAGGERRKQKPKTKWSRRERGKEQRIKKKAATEVETVRMKKTKEEERRGGRREREGTHFSSCLC